MTTEIGIRFTINYEEDLLVVGGMDSNIYLYDLTWESVNPREIKNNTNGPKSPVRSAGFISDSSKLLYITDSCHLYLLQRI